MCTVLVYRQQEHLVVRQLNLTHGTSGTLPEHRDHSLMYSVHVHVYTASSPGSPSCAIIVELTLRGSKGHHSHVRAKGSLGTRLLYMYMYMY